MQVLLAADGSIESDIASSMLEKLPLPKSTDIVVATVIEPTGIEALEAEVFLANTAQIRRRIARQMIDRIAGEWNDRGVPAQGLLLEGDASTELLALAQGLPNRETLFVCGSGAPSFSKMIGSVSRKLILYSGASVLVGRPFQQNAHQGSVSRIRAKESLDVLIAVDDQEGSKVVLDCLESMPNSVFENLYAVSIEPFPHIPADSDLSIYLPVTKDDLKCADRMAATAAKRLARCAQAASGISGIGRPSQEIARIAAEKDVDLVVVGASRHSPLSSFVVGSCSYELSNFAPCPVLILRSSRLFAA